MSKIDVGVGKEFPVESDEREREQRERERRERDERAARGEDEDAYGCGDWRDARDYYRARRRHFRRHWHYGPPGFFFPRILFIAAGVGLIIFAVNNPFPALIIGGIVALIIMNRRHGFLREIARELRQGWEGDDAWRSPRSGDSPQGPSAPRPGWDAPPGPSTANSGSPSSGASNTSNPTTGTGSAGSPA